MIIEIKEEKPAKRSFTLTGVSELNLRIIVYALMCLKYSNNPGKHRGETVHLHEGLDALMHSVGVEEL